MLHVANGTCTTTLIGLAGIPGDASIWADVLHEGPVPEGLSDADLRMARAEYLIQGVPGAGAAGVEDLLAEVRRWEAAVDRRAIHDEVILWFEHDLFDQLNLIQLLDRMASGRVPSTAVSLVSIDRFPGRPSFKGLGELTPSELASLLKDRRPVEHRQFDVARRAWKAFRAPNPQRIEDMLAEDLTPLPFLRNALRRHLEEFPSTEHGLSRSETRLLTLASAPLDTHAAFRLMAEDETCFYIGDTSFMRLARALASLDPSLITLDGDDRTADGLPPATVALTPVGQAVLDGRLDRVRDCGIDRWLGGVHLEGRGPTWRWDRAGDRLVWSNGSTE